MMLLTCLCIEFNIGRSQPNEASKQTLIQMTVLLEGHVLYYWWQLVMITNQYDTL